MFGQPFTLITASGDGTQISNSAAETSLLAGTNAKKTLPANFFNFIGQKLRVRASGRMSIVNPTPGTLTLKLTAGGTTMFTSGALNLNTTAAKTNVPWWFELDWTLRATGTAGNGLGIGMFQSETVIGSAASTAGGNGSLLLPTATPVVGSNIDWTAAQAIDLTWTFSVATNPTNCTLHQYELIDVNGI